VLKTALLGALATLLGACAFLPLADGSASLRPCADVYSDARCELMAVTAAIDLRIDREDIVSIAIVPEPKQFDAEGHEILQVRSGGPPIDVRVTLPDGSTQDVSMGCVGVAMQPVCHDDPALRADDVIGSGYHDVPCAGEPPAGCATPVPTPRRAAIAAAVPLRVGRLDIPIDRTGDYRVKLGEARLPNGWLTEASFAFVDDWPDGVTILSGRAGIELESLESAGKPFVNVYEHGWREGTERVAAFVVFHVDAFEPGAVLSIKDVVVE
jgi:hypothetical protein